MKGLVWRGKRRHPEGCTRCQLKAAGPLGIGREKRASAAKDGVTTWPVSTSGGHRRVGRLRAAERIPWIVGCASLAPGNIFAAGNGALVNFLALRVGGEKSGHEACFPRSIPDCSRRMVIDPYSGYALIVKKP